jgi:hypothetical protein
MKNYDKDFSALVNEVLATGQPARVERLSDNSGTRVSAGDFVGYVSTSAKHEGTWLYYSRDVEETLREAGVSIASEKLSPAATFYRLAVVNTEDSSETFGDWSNGTRLIEKQIETLKGQPQFRCYIQSMPMDQLLEGHEPASRREEILAEAGKHKPRGQAR